MDFEKTIEHENTPLSTREVLQDVYTSLEEKGYKPLNQISGYLLSGDLAYIPRHNDARNKIRALDRNEILEELILAYLNEK